jgi:hypothetical protein
MDTDRYIYIQTYTSTHVGKDRVSINTICIDINQMDGISKLNEICEKTQI